MPEALVNYWTAWNEIDLGAVPGHVADAVTEGVVWNDPRDSFVGRAALVDAVVRLRTSKPEYYFVVASEIDHHHDRFRYRWNMMRGTRVLMEGLDITTVDPASGLINRVDGFFGAVTPIKNEGSGIPEVLRQVTPSN